LKKIITIFLFICSFLGFSFIEKEVKVYSESMKKYITVTVILPNGYSKDKSYSTIYTLHGWAATNKSFSDNTSIGQLSDKYSIIYISPDGDNNSWYIDSEIKEDSKYTTFISKELVNYIDTNYSTKKDKKQRAITGFSMGGYGALYIGIKNPDIFGNIGSMSGGVNPEKIKKNYEIKKVMNGNWKKYNIKDIAYFAKDKNFNIIIDCGVSDFFIEMNRELHSKLVSLDIKHDYIERFGSHDWGYWNNSFEYQTYFFYKNFSENIN